MSEPDVNVPDPRPGVLPNVSGYVRWPEVVKILFASVLAGGFTVEGVAMLLHNLSEQMDLWYTGPESAGLKLVMSGLVTIVVGLWSGYKIAKAGLPPSDFKRIESKFADESY